MKIQASILAIFLISVILFGVVYGKVDDDAPKKCRNDITCIRAGLEDHYCRRIGPNIFESECVLKRGIYLVLWIILNNNY